MTSGILAECPFRGGTITGHYAKIEGSLKAEYRISLRVTQPDFRVTQMERSIFGMHSAAAILKALPDLTYEHDFDGLMVLLHAMKFCEFYAELPFRLNDGSATFTVRDIEFDGNARAEIVCTFQDDQDRVCATRYIHCFTREQAMATVEHLGFFMDDSCMIANALGIIGHLDNDAVTPVNDRTWL